MKCRTLKAVAAALTIFATTGFSLSARASIIMTFGGNTQYQDSWPSQYDLCLTVGSDYHLYSEYCNGSSSQDFAWDQNLNAITWSSGATTYYMTNHHSYVSMDTYDSFSWDQIWYSYVGSSVVSEDNSDCLDVLYGNTNSGAPLDVTTCNGTQAQWLWFPNTFVFETYSDTGALCLTEHQYNYTIDNCIGGNTQTFVLKDDGSIQNVSSGACLYVNSSQNLIPSSTCSGWTTGRQWPNNGWTHDYGFFQDATYGLCLDVYGNYKVAGRPVDVSSTGCTDNSYSNGNGNLAQFWLNRF
jgi:hypothetical protein